MPGDDAGSGETCVTFCVAESLSAVVSAILQHVDPQLVCCVRLRTQSSSPHCTAQMGSTKTMIVLSRVGPSQHAASFRAHMHGPDPSLLCASLWPWAAESAAP